MKKTECIVFGGFGLGTLGKVKVDMHRLDMHRWRSGLQHFRRSPACVIVSLIFEGLLRPALHQ